MLAGQIAHDLHKFGKSRPHVLKQAELGIDWQCQEVERVKGIVVIIGHQLKQ